MAKINPGKADGRKRILSFGGIRDSAELSADSADLIRNFRVRTDGSLEKRCGYRNLLSLPSALRGFWEGTLDGQTCCFAAAGNKVYRINTGDGTASLNYVLTTSSGDVSFAFYRDRLYLLDGANLFVFRPSVQAFSIAEAYTPLYGKNWHPTELGSVNEPLNLIQNRIRIHYLNTVGSNVFRLPFTMKQVDRVRVNGTFITNFTYHTATSTVQIPPELAGGGVVEIAATLDDVFSQRTSTLRSQRAIVYRDPHHETFLTTGGAPGYQIYRSTAVSQEMLDGSSLFYTLSDPLYLPETEIFTVGSTQHPVTVLCQCDEQVLVFNDTSMWALRHPESRSDEMQILLLNGNIGCCSPHGITMCGSDPITVQENGVFRLHFSVTDPDICSRTLLSGDLKDLLTPDLLSHAVLFWDRIGQELWMRCGQEADGTVHIYDPSVKQWFCYTDIPATCFFERGSAVGFGTDSGDLCVMDPSLLTDAGRPFEADYLGHFIGFPESETPMRSMRAALCATAGGTLQLQLETDRGTELFSLTGAGGPAPELFDMRLAHGRFRFLRFRIIAIGSEPCRVHFLSFSANN